jgi:hypothetical protein
MAKVTGDVALALGCLKARSAIHDVEAVRPLHDHLEQLLRRGQIVLRPAARIIAVHNRDRAQFARALRHIIGRLTLQFLGIGGRRLLGRGHRRHGDRHGQRHKTDTGEASGSYASHPRFTVASLPDRP